MSQRENAGFNAPLLNASFSAWEKVTLRFSARSADEVVTCVVMQRNSPPFPPCDKKWIKLTPEWKSYEVTLSSDNYEAGGALITFLFGETKGSLEIADPQLTK